MSAPDRPDKLDAKGGAVVTEFLGRIEQDALLGKPYESGVFPNGDVLALVRVARAARALFSALGYLENEKAEMPEMRALQEALAGLKDEQVNAIETVREALIETFADGTKRCAICRQADPYHGRRPLPHAAWCPYPHAASRLADLEALVQAAEALLDAGDYRISNRSSRLRAAVARVKGDTT